MTATELLDALDRSGAADSTVALGRRFVRHVGGEDPEALVRYLHEQRVTEGTILKARDLLSGRTTPDHYQGTPPPNGKDAEAARLAKVLGAELGRVLEEKLTRQHERQAEANAASIGNPRKQKEQLVGAK